MSRLEMNINQIQSTLGDLLDGYTTGISYLADNGDYSFYRGVAGNLADEEAGTKYDIRVNRTPDEYGNYIVEYRNHTGWEDADTGSWRWMTTIEGTNKI